MMRIKSHVQTNLELHFMVRSQNLTLQDIQKIHMTFYLVVTEVL